ncbi:glutathione S-transferase [Methylomonas sp. AM2-LC]|uniref:glutathione S-transferase family protein n=1 Tax=Methylomonas sp. AM2-LC TaxID=3153301 RepID=UPI00326619E2
MITLYGFAISNYYNKVKLTLLEKNIEFIEVTVTPSQDAALLERSPLGKIPFIKTESGQYLSESQAIVEYLEDAYPAHPLCPADSYERAKTREFIQHLELNVELIARRIYMEAFFGGKVSDEVKEDVKTKVETGLKGLTRLLKLAPYALGEHFSVADIVAWPHLQLISASTQIIYGKDLVAEIIPGIDAYFKQMEGRPHVQKVASDRTLALAQFLQKK